MGEPEGQKSQTFVLISAPSLNLNQNTNVALQATTKRLFIIRNQSCLQIR